MKTEVLLRSIGKINDELIADAESEANTKRKPGWAKLGIMAACLALVLCTGIAANAIRSNATAGTFTMDVNPSVEYTIAKSGAVKSIRSLNSDAEAALSGIVPGRQSVEAALTRTVAAYEACGYMKNGEATVLISFDSRLDANAELKASLSAEIQQTLEQTDAVGTLIFHSELTENAEVAKIAEEFHVSLGRADWILTAANKTSLPTDEVARMSLDELLKFQEVSGISSVSVSKFISLEEAKKIALKDAKLDELAQKIVFTREELNRNSGKPCYILEFYTGTNQYHYQIDAKSGSIIYAGKFITLSEAKKIALDDAGCKDKVSFTEETLVSGGIKSPYYSFAFESDTARWTYKIDAVLGVIMDKTCDKITPPAPEFIGLEKAKQIAEKAKRYPLVLQNVEKKKKQKEAPLLYDLTELQRDASARFGYSAKQTLNLMQSLYETHKVLTYPRTDSRYLTKDIVPTLKERLDAVSIGPYKALAQQAKRSPLNGKLSFVNDAKVSDHHAIIPTEQYVQLSALSNEERRIYDLVVRRFLAVLLPPCVYEETVIQASIEKECFTARGKRMVEKGWQEAYEDNRYDEEDEAKEEVREQNLPLLEAGMKIGQPKISLREGKTKPPARFTEGTLLSAMENPVRYMENRDSSLVKTIGEAGGLGTVATRADIIEKLFRSFLLEKKGNEIYLTSKARQLLKLVPADLKKPELTASWEMQLNDIAKGKKRRDVFMKEIRSYTVELIDEIKTEEGTFRHDNLTNKKCPNCGKRLLAVNGKNAKLLVCQDRECGYRETVSRTTNARCPVCHKRMEMIGKGEDATFVCACGHKERMTKFQERRKKEGGGVTKRDVAAYMKKQKKEAEEPVNNAFAAALKGIKL